MVDNSFYNHEGGTSNYIFSCSRGLCAESSAEETIKEIPFKDLTKPTNNLSRIVNGELAKDGEIPYIVALRITTNQGTQTICSGSIIGNSWILTAAQCTIDAYSVRILYGTTNLNTFRQSVVVYANSIINHKDYSRLTQLNDVALIHTGKVPFTQWINKIDLVNSRRPNYFKNHLTCGWGQTSMTSQFSADLRCTKLKLTMFNFCMPLNKDLAKNFLCAKNKGSSVCFGDAGGPLIRGDGTQKLLVGITSKINPYDCERLSSAFTPIASYRRWIQDITGI